MTLWLCLFLTYAIFYLEVFGLTRWESAETHLSNYYTFASTLVLLALQSTGEGWNECVTSSFSPLLLLHDSPL